VLVLGGELPVGHEIGLIVVAAIFIAFALASSFLVPRFKPDYPGPAGMSVFVIVSIVLFALMIAAVNFFG
jgi:Mg/Co/Ni transporter MgtE